MRLARRVGIEVVKIKRSQIPHRRHWLPAGRSDHIVAAHLFDALADRVPFDLRRSQILATPDTEPFRKPESARFKRIETNLAHAEPVVGLPFLPLDVRALETKPVMLQVTP